MMRFFAIAQNDKYLLVERKEFGGGGAASKLRPPSIQ